MRYTLTRDGGGWPIAVDYPLTTPRQSAAILVQLLQHEPSELFVILCLSTKRRVIASHDVSRGTLNSTLVHPRDVFKAAILANAAGMIVAHVHPSGGPTPSPDDRQLTRHLTAAGTWLGIDVLDHIIVGDRRYVSVREIGHL